SSINADKIEIKRNGVPQGALTQDLGAWSYLVPLSGGDNLITAIATFAGEPVASSASVTVVVDNEPPAIVIKNTTAGDTLTTTLPAITLAGVAADNTGVAEVTWTRNPGTGVDLSGTATGAESWSTLAIPLMAGTNVITVTASDIFGNKSSVSLNVARDAQTA